MSQQTDDLVVFLRGKFNSDNNSYLPQNKIIVLDYATGGILHWVNFDDQSFQEEILQNKFLYMQSGSNGQVFLIKNVYSGGFEIQSNLMIFTPHTHVT